MNSKKKQSEAWKGFIVAIIVGIIFLAFGYYILPLMDSIGTYAGSALIFLGGLSLLLSFPIKERGVGMEGGIKGVAKTIIPGIVFLAFGYYGYYISPLMGIIAIIAGIILTIFGAGTLIVAIDILFERVSIKWVAAVIIIIVIPIIFLAAGQYGPPQEVIDAGSQAWLGNGVPEASAYTSGSGIHPIVLLDASGNKHDWTAQVPRDWWPESVSDLELVVYIEEEEELIQTCHYTAGGTIKRYRHVVEAQLVVARTSETLATNIFQDDPRECPETKDVDIIQSLLGGHDRYVGHVSFDEVRGWLNDFVNP